MKPILDTRCEIIYHDETGRHVYWPADDRSDVLAEKLREARASGLKASLAEVADSACCVTAGRRSGGID